MYSLCPCLEDGNFGFGALILKMSNTTTTITNLMQQEAWQELYNLLCTPVAKNTNHNVLCTALLRMAQQFEGKKWEIIYHAQTHIPLNAYSALCILEKGVDCSNGAQFLQTLKAPENGYSVLQLAVYYKKMNLAQDLITKGKMNVNVQQGQHNKSLLHIIISRYKQPERLHALKTILQLGINVNCKDKEGQSPLSSLLYHGPSTEEVQCLLDHGAIITQSVLAHYYEMDMLRYLLARTTIKPNWQKIMGTTCKHLVRRDIKELLDLIRESGAEKQLNIKKLVIKVLQSRDIVFNDFVEYFNISVPFLTSMYAFHKAVLFKDAPANCYDLAEMGVSFRYPDTYGLYPLDYAMRAKNERIAKWLFKEGAPFREHSHLPWFLNTTHKCWHGVHHVFAKGIFMKGASICLDNFVHGDKFHVCWVFVNSCFWQYLYAHDKMATKTAIFQRFPSKQYQLVINMLHNRWEVDIQFFIFATVPKQLCDLQFQV